MTKTCTACGKDFEHTQQGRGRPPKRCPACRKAGLLPDYPVQETVTPERVLLSGTPKVGDRVVHTGLNISPKYYTVGKLLSINGESATVLVKGEKLTTRFSKLSLIGRAS